MFKAGSTISEPVKIIVGFHLPRIFFRVRLVFCEVLAVESREVTIVIRQVATLVNEGHGVPLKVCPIKELQLVWRYPVSLALLAADPTYLNEHRKWCQRRRQPWVSPLGSVAQGRISTGRQQPSLADP